MGADARPAAQRRTPLLRAIESDPRQGGFRWYVEGLCQRFYADEIGRPGLPPGRYFRLLLIGYFEGLDAERAIAWRAAVSFAGLGKGKTIGIDATTLEATRGITAIRSWSTSRRSACAATFRSRIAAVGIGRETPTPVTPCTGIGDGFAAHGGSGCCDSAASASNVRVPISMKPDACGASIYGGTTTFANDYWCMPVR